MAKESSNRSLALVYGVAGILAVLAAGCGHDTIKGPRTAGPDAVPLEGYPNVLLRDGLHRKLVLLGQPDVKPPTATSTMSVRVRLRSVADETVMIRYRFRFYGADREVLTRDPVWYTVDVSPTHDRTFEARAIQLTAADWELEVSLP